jgi:CheY-like chemotaxis protein
VGRVNVAQHELKTILLVEDERDIRSLVSLMLSKAGYRVLEAGDGDQAVSLWQEHGAQVDLLITDLLLPKRTGEELAIEFRAGRPDLKVIFVSGNLRESVVDTAHLVRDSKFLLKPFSPVQLLEIVRSSIGNG